MRILKGLAAIATIAGLGVTIYQSMTGDTAVAQTSANNFGNNSGIVAAGAQNQNKIDNSRHRSKTTNGSEINRGATQSPISNVCAPTQGNRSVAICGGANPQGDLNIHTGN